jgi:hypothetical protein
LIIERRPIHVHLSKDVHVEFRRMCIDEKVTMQEIVEHFVNGLVDERPEMLAHFKEFIYLKKHKKINKISKIETDDLFDKILEGDYK